MALLVLIMKNSHQYINLSQVVILLLTISSCSKFSEGVVHEIAFPEHTPRLATTLIVNDMTSVVKYSVLTPQLIDHDSERYTKTIG